LKEPRESALIARTRKCASMALGALYCIVPLTPIVKRKWKEEKTGLQPREWAG